MKWFAVLTALAFATSCGPGQLTYLDRVRPMPVDQAHPLYRELLNVLEKPRDESTDVLVRTWKEFLADTPRPLRAEETVTFVYYDFSHRLSQVFLEASFLPERRESLSRVGTTPLFVKVYSIPKPAQARYRFSDGTKHLPDPFQPDLVPGEEFWQPVSTAISADSTIQWIDGRSESSLEGQDLSILLPPSYRRNLALTYPLVVLTGLQGRAWIEPLAQLMEEGSIRPVIIASTGPTEGLKATLEERVVPFLRSRYRASALASELLLVGWGATAKGVQDLAAARPDFWTKTWIAPADQARTEAAWSTLAPAFFRTQFAVVVP